MATRDVSVRRVAEDYGVFVLLGVVACFAVAGIALVVFGDASLVDRWLNQYGLAVLFFILILEGAMLLYFAPSEALVPAGVTVLARTTDGYEIVTVVAVVLVSVCGATVGQYLLFALAKRGGREYLTDKPWFRVSDDSLDRFERWFDKWGRAVVPISNALLFTRGMLTVPAGFAEMDDAEFVALSALGSLVFQSWLALVAMGVFPHVGL